jgi:uncharacterized protein (TIGR02996 family)
MSETFILRVASGVTADVPSDEFGPLTSAFSEGTSWLATLTPVVAPEVAFGEKKKKRKTEVAFDREFWRRTTGAHYRAPFFLKLGTVVEFGVNRRVDPDQPRTPPINPAPAFQAFAAAGVIVPSKRRWVGVVTEIDYDGDNGQIILLHCEDAQKAFAAAMAYHGHAVPGDQSRDFLTAFSEGDMAALLIFSDWLTEQGDRRGDWIKDKLRELVMESFPEHGDLFQG